MNLQQRIVFDEKSIVSFLNNDYFDEIHKLERRHDPKRTLSLKINRERVALAWETLFTPD